MTRDFLLAASVTLLLAAPACADDADRIAAELSGHLTRHGAEVVKHEAKLVEIGDVSFSGLKDDLREACKTAEECLRVHDISAPDAQMAMYVLVARRTELELDVKIKAMQAGNEHIRRLSDELAQKRDKGDAKEVDRLKKEIDRLNEESQLSMIDIQRMVNKRNEAFDTLTNIMNKFQRTLDSIIHNMR